MTLTDLHLFAFKNHSDAQFAFQKGVNCVVGKNGVGKTNLLDAINFLAFARTALNTTDAQCITEGSASFSVRGIFKPELTIACGYEFRKGKLLKVDGQEQPKTSEHVGTLPLVFTTPDDSDIVREGSEYRRKFFDGAIAQVDKEYLNALIKYRKILQQRNEHLKSAEHRGVDHKLLDTYDDQLIPLSIDISSKRRDFLGEFVPFFSETYGSLHKTSESPSIQFESNALAENFKDLFASSREKDMILKRTMEGSHRDKYEFQLNDQPIKKFGSQGQQKTFIISLRLAEYDFLRARMKKHPLLLLDDIFDKLDDDRIKALVKTLSDKKRFEQIFITDARRERSETFFKDQKVNFIALP